MAERALGKGARELLGTLAQPKYWLEYSPSEGGWFYLWNDRGLWESRYRSAQITPLQRRDAIRWEGGRRWTITQAGRDLLAE